MSYSLKYFLISALITACLLLQATISPSFAAAQEIQSDKSSGKHAATTQDKTSSNSLEEEALSLDEASRIAIAKNVDIRIFLLDKEEKQQEIPANNSIYDTRLNIEGGYSVDEKEPSSSFAGDHSTYGEISTSLQQQLPTGTKVEINHDASRSSSNSSANFINPYYEGSTSISISQPLLKNGFGTIDRKSLKRVRLDVKRFDYETRDRIEAEVALFRKAYWELEYANQNLLTKNKALEQAQALFDSTKNKLSLGLVERPDLYATEANVRIRELDSLQASNTLLNRNEEVLIMLDWPEGKTVRPTSRPRPPEEPEPLEEYLSQAYENRLDLKQLKLEAQRAEILVVMKRSGLLPELDIEASMASNGLDRKAREAHEEIFDFDSPTLFTGFRFSFPINNRLARSEYNQAKIQKKRILLLLKQIEQKIALSVREAYRNLLLAKQRVNETASIEKLQQLKVDEEMRSFERGRSDSALIIDYQEDLITAQDQAERAKVDYELARDALLRAQNRLLETEGLIAK